MPRRPLEERIALAREIGCEITVSGNGNGKIGAVYGRVSGAEQALESIWSLKRQRGLAEQATNMNYSAVISILADMAALSLRLDKP